MSFNFSSINLGCNKNLVDLEFAIGEILKFSDKFPINYFENPEDEEVEYVIINTCGFLSSSREESEMTIKYFDDLGKKIIILGCYISVKNEEFLSGLKNLYKIIPFINYEIIEDIIFDRKKAKFTLNKEKILDLKKIGGNQINTKAFVWKSDKVRAYMNAPFGYEYLKIAEGCDNNCTFCIIPKIRGRQKSRTIEDIVAEVKIMLDNGIKEIILIAQDTTRYGVDLYSEPKLIELLEEIEKINGDFKYRLLYMYPDNLTLINLEKLKTFKKFIPYFDIPFQHISEHILKKMGRFYDKKHITNLLDFIKNNFPSYHLRTAFIVGFPGETKEDLQELKEFIQKYSFDSIALFEYHDEALAASSKLPEKVPQKTALNRIKELDIVINNIYSKKNKSDKGKKFTGFIMDYDTKKAIVRRELKAPEIDEYDNVPFSKITGNIEIGEKVEYKL
ncbi:MiaB/RimO family radical SAM methylthiotransferase [Candidatus Gracilibacteria bacterium]|nr:MiaB/RimO family radical SAM methylthiotransferase [Candidatus Gracilibacteria bacterium]